TFPVVVASIDYVKRPEVLHGVSAVHWDIVVVDEAHGSTLETGRHAAASVLCRQAPFVVLLTATPHNGDERAFRSLCALGEVNDTIAIFRRMRKDVAVLSGRRAHRLFVRVSGEERDMFDAVSDLLRRV